MPAEITDAQRRLLLQFVAQHSPEGQAFHLEKLPGISQTMFGVDLGWGLLTLASEGLCGTEEPDIVWATPEGLVAHKEGNWRVSRKAGSLKDGKAPKALLCHSIRAN
ncbi:hypothetical protein ACVIGB_000454 [Bradyrhizobium sp. USDA 4341]